MKSLQLEVGSPVIQPLSCQREHKQQNISTNQAGAVVQVLCLLFSSILGRTLTRRIRWELQQAFPTKYVICRKLSLVLSCSLALAADLVSAPKDLEQNLFSMLYGKL